MSSKRKIITRILACLVGILFVACLSDKNPVNIPEYKLEGLIFQKGDDTFIHPVEDVFIALEHSGKIDTTRSVGNFYEFSGIPAGTWQLTAFHPAYQAYDSTFRIHRDASITIYLKPTDPDYIPPFEVDGRVAVKFGSKKFPLADAVVKTGNFFGRTDIAGRFELKGLTRLENVFQISHPYTADFDTIVDFAKIYPRNLYFIVETSEETVDYWPLKVGNKWIFDYHGGWIHAFDSDRCDGTESWEIIEKNVAGNWTQFRVRKIFSGKYYTRRSTPYPVGFIDSLIFEADTSYFDLAEDQSGMLEIQYKLARPPEPAFFEFMTLERRFLSPVFGDTLDFQTGYPSVKNCWHERYVKDVGPSYISKWEGGNHQWSYSLKLVDYEIAK